LKRKNNKGLNNVMKETMDIEKEDDDDDKLVDEGE
jgi:hypothetical protein